MSPQDLTTWTLSVGETVRRQQIHDAYGGQRQSGIVTPRSLPNDILVFTDPRKGARYGYDEFEGLREDGSYAYTGEGQTGDQTFVRGNKALRNSIENGQRIRLFRSTGTRVTYVGAFTLGEPPYRVESIPDLHGNPRQGLIFNLVPLDADTELLPTYGRDAIEEPQVVPWTAPEFSDVVANGHDALTSEERRILRAEFELQAEFGHWLQENGLTPSILKLPIGSSVIEPDLYVESTGWVVEAKKSTARSYIRTAIGQVLDYAHVAQSLGIEAKPAILLPGRPSDDLVGLIQKLHITLIARSAEGFEVVEDHLGVEKKLSDKIGKEPNFASTRKALSGLVGQTPKPAGIIGAGRNVREVGVTPRSSTTPTTTSMRRTQRPLTSTSRRSDDLER